MLYSKGIGNEGKGCLQLVFFFFFKHSRQLPHMKASGLQFQEPEIKKMATVMGWLVLCRH